MKWLLRSTVFVAFALFLFVVPLRAGATCCCTVGQSEDSTHCSTSTFENDTTCSQLQSAFQANGDNISLYSTTNVSACTTATKANPVVCCCPPIQGSASDASCATISQTACTAKTGWSALSVGLGCKAITGDTTKSSTDPTVYFTPEVTIPNAEQNTGTEFTAGVPVEVTGKTLGLWVSAFYAFFSGIIGIFAAVMIMFGGFQWMTARGNSQQVGQAKERIFSAIIAMVITFSSYLILRTINPNLVVIKDLNDILRPVSYVPFDSALLEHRTYTEELLGNDAAAEARRIAENKDCPSLKEMQSGFDDAETTGYYRPKWPSDAGYDISFACNVAMNCYCADSLDTTKSCRVAGQHPCSAAWIDAHGADKANNYCIKTAANTKPHGPHPIDSFEQKSPMQQPYTAAADSAGCFGKGTKFVTTRLVNGKYEGTEWIVEDAGSAIRGRHFDLFMGEGPDALHDTGLVTGKATIVVETLVDRTGNPTVLNTCRGTTCTPVPLGK